MKSLSRFAIAVWSLLFLFACLSCNKGDVDGPPTLHKSIHFVSKENAVDLLSKISWTGSVPKKLASLGTQRKKISEVVTINADDAEPALYVINYETGGFVILSADNRVEPILAYSESNYFESENVTYPEGLVEWMDEQKAYVSSVRTGKGEQSPQVKKLWDNPNIIIKQGGDDEDNPAPGEPGECDPKYYEYGPLLTAEWNQCFGFNEQMAPAPTSCMLCPWNDRALAGCVPLAIAQIMWYYNYPTNYNWAAMPATFGAPATQDLSGISGM